MEDSDTDFEEPSANSTQFSQIIEKKHKNSKEIMKNFMLKGNSATANLLLKQKMKNETKAGILKPSKVQSLPKQPKLPKLNKFDDEFSGSGSNTQRSTRKSSSSSEESESDNEDKSNKSRTDAKSIKQKKLMNNSATSRLVNNNGNNESSSNDSQSSSSNSDDENNGPQRKLAKTLPLPIKSIKTEETTSKRPKTMNKLAKTLPLPIKTIKKEAKTLPLPIKTERKFSSSEENSSSDDQSDKEDNSEANRTNVNLSSSSEDSSHEDVEERKKRNQIRRILRMKLKGQQMDQQKRQELVKKNQIKPGVKSKKTTEKKNNISSESESTDDEKTSTTPTVTQGGRRGIVSSSSSSESEIDLLDTTTMETTLPKAAPTKTIKHLDEYLNCFNLKPASTQDAKFTLDDVTSDDEVFTVKIVKSLEPQMLIDTKITFKKEQDVFLGEKKFSIKCDKNDTKQLNLMAPKSKNDSFALRQIKTSGSIVINEATQMPLEEKPQAVFHKSNEKVAFPSGSIKSRHPLFGTDYEKRICLDQEVSRKLDELIKEMSAKHQSDEQKRVGNSPEKISKAGKRKTSTIENDTPENPLHKKKKEKRKKAKEKNESVVQDDNLRNGREGKDIQNGNISSEHPLSCTDSQTSSKDPESASKKKKKRSTGEGVDSVFESILSDVKQEAIQEEKKIEELLFKKKKKRKHSISETNSDVKEEIVLNPEAISSDVEKSSKKKKKKRHSLVH